VVLLATLLQASLSVGVASSLVLCTGADGHLAIESALAGDCCDAHGLPERAARLRSVDACGCTDTPLLRPTLDGRRPAEHAAALALAASAGPFCLVAVPPGVPCRVAARLAASRIPPPVALTALRAIVLVV
jgi:hypothetical protein